MALLMREFCGAAAILAAHAPALPQPDQLCGPFTAHLALHALLASPPSVAALASASGTSIWPHELDGSRPIGAPLVTTGWDQLPRAGDPDTAGTTAAGVAAGVESCCADIAVVRVPTPNATSLVRLFGALLDTPVGILANVHTGPITDPELGWAVGHFVIVVGYDAERAEVLIADTYREMGAPGHPPGCRTVGLAALVAALADRGLLLLVDVDQKS
ncbi:MAG: hypothetical protein WBA00_02050 [Rhodococcus sp. (in: high G+C Gram-positive bacteria)]